MAEEKYQYMTFEQRKLIKTYLGNGDTPMSIAKLLGVHHATIYREIRRGSGGKPCNKETNYDGYDPEFAQEIVNKNIKRRGRATG